MKSFGRLPGYTFRPDINVQRKMFLILYFILFFISACAEPDSGKNFAVIPEQASDEQIIRIAANIVPSGRQMAWQELEFMAFIHMTVNTFTDREWGEGTEDPALFNPTDLDARQWARVCRDAGMKQIIVTAKHHDGFCLWPTDYTDHSVRSCPWKDGKGDVLKEVSEACREFGLKFGVYLSPWDRHEPTYGTDAYNDFLVNQLQELLTRYGAVHEVWFDGACGEGPNGKRQVYDWERYYQTIRKLQPEAVIAIVGPDVRWVGTETGYGRLTEWSVVPAAEKHQGMIQAGSQTDVNLPPLQDMTGEDLGSREMIKNARMLVWYPSEVDVSIRPGWFYHASEDHRVKTPQKLVDIYYSSLGRNSVLLLNLPPDRRGRIHENDIQSLKGMRKILDHTFDVNLAEEAVVTASSSASGTAPEHILDNRRHTFWAAAPDQETAIVTLQLRGEKTFDRLMLKENIRTGQRIENFHLDARQNGEWETIAKGTTVGYMRLLRFPAVTADTVRLVIDRSRTNPTLLAMGLYKAPPEIQFSPAGGTFIETMQVELTADTPSCTMYYTLEGSEPTAGSTIYNGPISLTESTSIKVIAVSPDGKSGLSQSASYRKAKHGIILYNAYSPKYSGGGDLALLDGLHGSVDLGDGRWQGYEGTDMDVVVDLGKRQKVNSVSVGFLEDWKSWIFLPKTVRIGVSSDGKMFEPLKTIANNRVPQEGDAFRRVFSLPVNTVCRFMRLTAQNIHECPEGHPGAGGKAWLFADEITIK